MKNKVFSRSVRFRDAEKIAWTVDFELREIDSERRNRSTLETYRETQEASFSGNGGSCGGQIDGHITPRTDGQKELLDLWNRYHLCGMVGGTDKQEEYLRGSQYKADYDKFVEIFSRYDENFRMTFDSTAWKILHNIFQFDVLMEPWIHRIVDDNMGGNPIIYILGNGKKTLFYGNTHDSTDYHVRCFFLSMKGLYNDRDYVYGKGWLFEPLPADMQQVINNLFDKIEAEEEELTESLTPVFDMGAEDFKATPKIINQVMELRDCCETEAKRFIALGMFLGYTFGDLNNTFEEVDDAENLYRADGEDYYIGTEEELQAVAEGRMEDGDYDDLWREAVRAEQTELGLRDWCQQVIDIDGWCSILNSWDGRYESFKVGDEWICVSRT